MSLKEEEQQQVIQLWIEKKKACSTCAPLVYCRMQELNSMTVDFYCETCHRAHYYHRHVFTDEHHKIHWMWT